MTNVLRRSPCTCALMTIVALVVAGPTRAQVGCTEGRTASGQCVDAPLAATARRSSILFSQPKISYTAYPILPTGDSVYRYPNQLNPNPLNVAPLGPFILGPGGKVILFSP